MNTVVLVLMLLTAFNFLLKQTFWKVIAVCVIAAICAVFAGLMWPYAIEQSKNDARDGENPVVMHRRNRKEWLVTMPLADWMKMYGKALHDN